MAKAIRTQADHPARLIRRDLAQGILDEADHQGDDQTGAPVAIEEHGGQRAEEHDQHQDGHRPEAGVSTWR